MPIPTSPEFVTLCQAQLALLTQGLGASMGVVYWSEVLTEGAAPQLVPIAAAPEYLMSQSLGRLSPASELPPKLAAGLERADQAGPAWSPRPRQRGAGQRSPGNGA
jgi:hypothetical protein